MKLENQMKTGLGDRYKRGDDEYIVASAGINKVVVAAGAAPNH